jgi:hypothetical protein
VNNKEQPALAVVANAWKHAPHRLISLWDMKEFFAQSLFLALDDLEVFKRGLDTMDFSQTERWPIRGNALIQILEPLETFAKELEMEGAVDRCFDFLCSLRSSVNPNRPVRPSIEKAVVRSEIEGIQNSLKSGLLVRKFVFIPKNKIEYFEQPALFGEDVNTAFPSACRDIQNAGNCLALDLSNATIFHLMCVVEIGLRAFAKHLKVRIKKTPLEYADWGKILVGINLKIEAIRKKQGQPKPKRTKDLEFYSGVWGEFNGFKDVWHNNVMHVRKPYSENQAQDAYSHVRDFMLRLAERISEK